MSAFFPDDVLWFAVHLDRSHRIRPALPSEPQHLSRVIVRRLEPGFYRRISFDCLVSVPDIEEMLHAVFDVIAEAALSGHGEMSNPGLGREVLLRVYAMARGGNA
jgi:hypothetical protein